jgi:CRISPR-associated protein Cmr2
MSKQVFAIFQIGPVQEFIICARRTQDYWCGSYLLSYLNCCAINMLLEESEKSKRNNGRALIYPAVANQQVYEYVNRINRKSKKPWEDPPKDKELNPTIPNRLVGLLPDGDAESILSIISAKVPCRFKEIAFHVLSELYDQLFNGAQPRLSGSGYRKDVWDNIVKRQIEEFFEVYWTISPADNGSYDQSYLSAIRFFEARRAIKNFPSNINKAEPGHKCTLCGEREPLNAQVDGSIDRHQLSDFWQKVREATGHYFKEGEHLCAICTTKRLAPYYVFKRRSDMPSTSTIAVSDFILSVSCQYQHAPQKFKTDNGVDVLKDFLDKAQAASNKLREPFEVEPPPLIKSAIGDTLPLDKLKRLEGDWLYREHYENLERRHAVDGDTSKALRKMLSDARQALQVLLDTLKSVGAGALPSPQPAKYYGLVRFDGDDMGEHISNCKSKDDHQALSKAMSDFSVGGAPQAIEESHLGKIVYFGGDEGVALVPMSQILDSIRDCRSKFVESFSKFRATISVGGVIAHHQHPLTRVIQEADAALRRAKQLGGKDGFCMAIMKRSGGAAYARAKWQYDNLDVADFLNRLVGYYKNANLSDAWWYELRREEWAFRKRSDTRILINTDTALLEISRLLRRHNIGMSEPDLDLTIKQTVCLLERTAPEWDDFAGLMELASFLARGGD